MADIFGRNIWLFSLLPIVTLMIRASMASLAEVKLKQALFNGYDASVRPANVSVPIVVKFGLSLNQLIDLDERNQILYVSLWFRYAWTDFFMKWNSTEYDGLKDFRTKPTNVWLPDITLYNDVREEERDVLKFDVIVHNTGDVMWLYPIVMRTACRINVRYFPFDQQVCKFKFGSWSYDGLLIDLRNRSEEGDLSNFVPNGEWDVLEIPLRRHVLYYKCCPEPFPDLTFYVVMRRRPLFYLFNLVLPCVVIMIITFVGFLLPPDSGEKVSLGVTCLLALTVFLLLVAETLPTQSEVVPLIGQFFGGTIILLSLSTGMTVIVLNLHFKGQHQNKLPHWLRKVAFEGISRALFMYSVVTNLEKETRLVHECHMIGMNDAERQNTHQNGVVGSNRSVRPKKTAKVDAVDPQTNGSRSGSLSGIRRRPLTPMSTFGRPLDEIRFHSSEISDSSLRGLVQSILDKMTIFEKLRLEDERAELIDSEWRVFAAIVDRLLLLLFMIVGAIMCLVFLTQGRDYTYDLEKVV